MKRLAKLSTLLAGALVAALTLSACGGADPADTVAPTVELTDSVTDATATGPVTFTFTFSEEVKGFTAEDVTVTGGDKASTVTAGSTNKVYTLVVTPTANTTGTISVSIDQGKFTDVSNNPNAAVPAVTQAYNTAPVSSALTFEQGGRGASFTWSTFENGANPGVEIVANPASGGVNTSAKVAKFTSLKIGQAWAGFESKHGADFGAMTLSMSNAVVKIMVYKPVISNVGIKFATASGGSTGEIKVANTKINQWEELTFDFSGVIGGVNDSIDQIILFPDFGVRDQDNVSYVDNITFSAKEASAPVAPTTAAPTPTAAASNVIALFSNAYTNKTVDTWRTSWSAATLTEIKISADDVKKYSGLDFVGIEAMGANAIDATQMTHVNFDVWTPNATTVRLKLVDFGSPQSEFEVAGVPTVGQWTTVKIPLADFTGLKARANLSQFIFSALPTGAATVFLDNIYFSKESTPLAPTTAAPTPTKASGDVISLFSNAYTNKTIDTWRTSWSAATLTEMKIADDDVKKYSGLDFVGIEAMGANAIDATQMTHVSFDVWTSNATTVRLKLVNFIGSGNSEFEVAKTPTAGTWNTIKIPLADFTGLTARANLSQFIFSALPTGTATVFIDNLYFSK